jgi:hypothetical protein
MKTILGSRKQHYMVRVGIFLVVAALIAGMAGCNRGSSPGDVVPIYNWEDLDEIRENLRGSYLLMNDLTATTLYYGDLAGPDANDGKGWAPIGTYEKPFTGTFDGGGNTISDLFIARPDDDNVGLFGYVEKGTIKNVGVVEANVTGSKQVGALVGYNWNGRVESDPDSAYSTHSTGSVAGKDDVGGLVGYNHLSGVVGLCHSTAEVRSASWRAGGLVGHNSGDVLYSKYDGRVTGDREVGGLVGLNKGRVRNSDGIYTVTGNAFVGGVAGLNLRTGGLRNVNFNGDVNGVPFSGVLTALSEGITGNSLSSDTVPDGWYVGGVVGFNEGTVEDCSASGTVTGISYVGGLAGGNDGTVDNCSSSGSVTGESVVGKLVGYNTGIVSNSDTTSCVTGAPNCGELVGWDEGSAAPPEPEYRLTIYSTTGGSATGYGYTSSDEWTWEVLHAGDVVSLTAEAEEGYRFVNWTAPAGLFGDAYAATTTFTMPALDVTVTANFEPVLKPVVK